MLEFSMLPPGQCWLHTSQLLSERNPAAPLACWRPTRWNPLLSKYWLYSLSMEKVVNETLERVFSVLQWICFFGSIESTQTVVKSGTFGGAFLSWRLQNPADKVCTTVNGSTRAWLPQGSALSLILAELNCIFDTCFEWVTAFSLWMLR